MSQPLELISELLAAVEDSLESGCRTGVSKTDEMAVYALGGGGKRIRPAVFLLCAKALGASSEKLADVAAAIEMIHTASLLHDDIVDNSSMRRWRESVQAKWGKRLGVLVGDQMWQRSLSIALDRGGERLVRAVSDAIGEVVKGELREAVEAGNVLLDQASHVEVIKGKTGQLFSLAARCAAIVVDAPKELEDACMGFGLNFGIAYQLIDDAKDYVADDSDTGKPRLQDLMSGRITYPVIAAIPSLSEIHISVIRSFVGCDLVSPEDAARVADIVISAGGVNKTISLANEYYAKARSFALLLPKTPYTDALLDMTTQ